MFIDFFFSDTTNDDVKKLKVRIELNGLRLNKLHQWLLPGQKLRTETDRKVRLDVPTFVRGDGLKGKTQKSFQVVLINVSKYNCSNHIHKVKAAWSTVKGALKITAT